MRLSTLGSRLSTRSRRKSQIYWVVEKTGMSSAELYIVSPRSIITASLRRSIPASMVISAKTFSVQGSPNISWQIFWWASHRDLSLNFSPHLEHLKVLQRPLRLWQFSLFWLQKSLSQGGVLVQWKGYRLGSLKNSKSLTQSGFYHIHFMFHFFFTITHILTLAYSPSHTHPRTHPHTHPRTHPRTYPHILNLT